MNLIIISIDHYLQLLEDETDSEALRGSKARLRGLFRERTAYSLTSASGERRSDHRLRRSNTPTNCNGYVPSVLREIGIVSSCARPYRFFADHLSISDTLRI
jgi:hypothetical protein